MSPQAVNTITRGFSFLLKVRPTSNISSSEDFFMLSGSNALIYFERTVTNNQIGFGLRNTAIAGDVYVQTQSNVLQNQVYVFAGRYDPYVAGGTATLYMNGSNVGSSSNNCTNIKDSVLTSVALGSMAFNGDIHCCAMYNRALTDREISDSSALLMDRPNTANTLEIGSSVSGKPSLVVREDGSVQVAGPIVGANCQAWAAIDYGVSNLSLQGYTVGTVAPVGMSPYAARAGDGSLYFNGSISNYIAFPSGIANPYTGGVQDTTFEAWVYITQSSTINMIMGRASSPSSGVNDWGIYFNNSSLLSYVYGANGTQYIASHQVPLATNTWNHVAMTVASGVVRVFLNGLLGTTSATIVGNARYNAAYNTYIGCFNNVAGNMFYGYMANIRILSGVAAYTANFVPPTGPMGPVAGANALLCMRVQQGPGRVLIPRIGGTTQAQAYPPVAMTTNVTNIQNAAYGNGVYVASASTELDSGSLAYNAFSKAGTWWNTAVSYNSSGVYTGSFVTADISGAQYAGEWIQLQMPSATVLSSLTISNYTGDINYMCKSFVLLGSSDGVKWTNLLQVSGISSISPASYNVSTQQAFTIFRIVATSIYGTATRVVIEELVFYGTKESLSITQDGQVGIGVSRPIQALEVAGNAVFGGNISAGNLGMFRNRIINGDMRIAQRGSGGNFTTGSSTNLVYNTVDRYGVTYNIASGGLTTSQVTLATTDAPYKAGLKYSVKIAATSATAISYTWIQFGQAIEGINLSDLQWGSAGALPIVLSFWIRSSVAVGSNIPVTLAAVVGPGYSYNFNVVSAGASTWQYVSQIIPGNPSADVSATYMTVFVGAFNANKGSTVLNTWQNANNIGSSSAFDIWAAGGNIEITGLQLEKGTMATPFEFRPYAIELQMCQRYYEVIQTYGNLLYFPLNRTNVWIIVQFKVVKRSAPSFAVLGPLPYTLPGVLNYTSTFTIGGSVQDIRSATVQLNLTSDTGTAFTYPAMLVTWGGGTESPFIAAISEL
jgi:hypothetical protein